MEQKKLNNANEFIYYLFSGFCMGCADIVPGVSGGTMAFILGFYEKLIDSVKNFDGEAIFLLFTAKFSKLSKKISLSFIATLLTGIILALATLSNLIARLLNEELSRIYLYSAFLGLILASALFCAKKVERWNRRTVTAFAIGGVIAYMLTSLTLAPNSNERAGRFDVEINEQYLQQREAVNYDREQKMVNSVSAEEIAGMFAKGYVNRENRIFDKETQKNGTVADLVKQPHYPLFLPWIILSGAIAISAMLLPGISGSYLLTILGSYPIVIGAVADFTSAAKHLSFDGEAAILLANFILGVAIGASLFSHIISWLFAHYHNSTIALLVGFMIGALRTVWPFWDVEYLLIPLRLSKGAQLVALHPIAPDFSTNVFWPSLSIAILSFSLVFAIELISQKKKRPC